MRTGLAQRTAEQTEQSLKAAADDVNQAVDETNKAVDEANKAQPTDSE